MAASHPRRLLDVFLRRVASAEADIVCDRVLKQVDVLKHHRHFMQQRFRIHAANIFATHCDRSPIRVVKPGDEAQHGALAAARRTDQCGERAGRHVNAHVVQHRLVAIAERDLPEFDIVSFSEDDLSVRSSV